jgi:SAM-dependent methyltransferase
VLAAGRAVTGTDQSSGMLARAAEKHPEAVTEHVGLQELPYDAEFDAVICVDAMENVFPEDWPVVLANLRRAVRPGGEVYLTVERTPEPVLIESFAEATAQGLPVVHGEMVARGGAGYHYYPPIGQVGAWIAGAGLDVVAEEEAPGEDDSYSYEHILLRRPAPGELSGSRFRAAGADWLYEVDGRLRCVAGALPGRARVAGQVRGPDPVHPHH